YIAYLVVSNYNASIFVAIIVSIIFATIIGVILEIVAYRPVVNAPPINSFIIALALMMVIDNVATVVFGSNQVSIRSASNEVFSLGSVSLSEHRLYLLLTTFILVTGLYLFMKYSKTGKAIRAVSQNKEAAQVVGINTNRISSIVFGLGSGMAGAAGAFMGILF